MNIDKFGHHIHKNLRFSELLNFRENCLVKKNNGEYNLYFHRLKGVKSPQDADEVVNLEYLDHRMNAFYHKYDIDMIIANTKKEIMREVNDLITNLKTEIPSNNFQLKRKLQSGTLLDKIDFVPE